MAYSKKKKPLSRPSFFLSSPGVAFRLRPGRHPLQRLVQPLLDDLGELGVVAPVGAEGDVDLRVGDRAFLEINRPSIPEGIELCTGLGAERIVLLPYFLHLGNHVGKDLPRLMLEGQIRHPEVEIILGPHLGYHPKLAEIVQERLAEALEGVTAEA